MRAAIRARLTRSADGFAVVAELADLDDVQQLCAAWAEHQPDLVLLGMRCGAVDGPQAVAALLAERPAARVVVLSGFDDDESVSRARDAGAAAFLHKSVSAPRMRSLLQEVGSGQQTEFQAVLPAERD